MRTATSDAELVLDIEPVPASRPRVTRRGISYYAEPYRSHKQKLKELLQKQWPIEPLKWKRLVIDIEVVVKRPKATKLDDPLPDVDNYAKAVLDAMNKVVIADDKYVKRLTVEKAWADPGSPGYIRVRVKHY